MQSQEIIQLRIALNAQKYLVLHYLQQQEIGTSKMHSTRGNSYVYLLCLIVKGCKAAYKNTQNRESKGGIAATEGTEFFQQERPG